VRTRSFNTAIVAEVPPGNKLRSACPPIAAIKIAPMNATDPAVPRTSSVLKVWQNECAVTPGVSEAHRTTLRPVVPDRSAPNTSRKYRDACCIRQALYASAWPMQCVSDTLRFSAPTHMAITCVIVIRIRPPCTQQACEYAGIPHRDRTGSMACIRLVPSPSTRTRHEWNALIS